MTADEDTAIRIRGRAKIEFERKVAGKVAHCGKLLNTATLGRRRDDKPAVDGAVPTVIRLNFAIEARRRFDNRISRHLLIAGSPFLDVGHFSIGRFTEAPAIEVAAVEERFESRLRRKRVGLLLDEPERGEQRPKSCLPLVVADIVRM